jgi:hypothetical protein
MPLMSKFPPCLKQASMLHLYQIVQPMSLPYLIEQSKSPMCRLEASTSRKYLSLAPTF